MLPQRVLPWTPMSALTSPLSVSPASGHRTSDNRGGSVASAREALAYWRRREESLPWRRRAARAEARDMIARSRGQLISAHLEHWGFGSTSLIHPLARMLALPRREQKRWLASMVLRNRFARRLRRMAMLAGIASVAVLATCIVVATQVL
jgi:hypothetical protein